jgi:hypothetical protein
MLLMEVEKGFNCRPYRLCTSKSNAASTIGAGHAGLLSINAASDAAHAISTS